MKYKIFILIIFTFFCGNVYAADVANTGFIPGQIWYSENPLIEGQTVKIYTAVWNGDNYPLQANVEFYDKNVILGTRSISVPKDSIQNVSISWKVTAGDHVISAKILASKIIESGKSSPVVLERNKTEEDRKFVSKLIEQIDGTPVSSTDAIKNKLDETKANLSDILPSSIGGPISDSLSSVDTFRDETYTKITVSKDETKKEIESINNKNTVKGTAVSDSKKVEKKSLGGADKPIAYIKLFFLGIFSFIFGTPFVFYLVIAFVLFLIIRSIYRKLSFS
ncbi:MAG: hypothetical protein KBD48_01100 [Candidatus Pacebacteria bacterium]|nr:hypothetical protein [Candidatus Paceibacterota bacterium]MBP9715775.1 hypothetical protein [Candidatus Paceibacterota bacterium]